jgi:CRISPR/Cas system-associated protein Cas7 (RAMP superfamily)
MIENPISQPTSMNGGATLSDDLVEKAARLMNNGQTPITETRQKQTPQQSIPSITADDIRSIVRETMEEVLKENGLLVESTTKTNEQFKFRVGQHMFEGKLSKIRKISE